MFWRRSLRSEKHPPPRETDRQTRLHRLKRPMHAEVRPYAVRGFVHLIAVRWS